METASGNVVAVRNGVAVVLNVGDAVYRNDVIQTGANSAVGIAFIDASAFNLSANGRMMLNEFIYNPGGTGNSSLLNLVQGAATFISGQVSKTGEMFVQTPSATVGIRGTVFQLEIQSTDGTARLSVINYDSQLHQVVIRPAGLPARSSAWRQTRAAYGPSSRQALRWKPRRIRNRFSRSSHSPRP